MKPVRSLLYLLVICVLILMAWPHLFLKGQIPVDGNVLRLFYPNWTFLHSHPVTLFNWPLWNPYRNMGEPFLADPQSLAAYPPMWLLSRLPSYLSFVRLWILGHSLLAAYFMGKWVLHITGDPASAATSMAIAVFNGYFMAHATLPNHFAAAAYVPAVFYFFETNQVVALAAALALQWLAGFPPFSYLTGVALVAWSFFSGTPKRKLLWRGGGLAVGLAAFQVIPFLELFFNSSRPIFLTPTAAVDFSEPWRQLARMLVIPQWFAWEPQLAGDQAVVSFYAGPFVILTAGWAVWKGQTRERLLFLGTFFSFLLSLGAYLPGYVSLTPLHLFRFPANWLLLSLTGMSLLSAIGISHFKYRRWKWMSALLILVDLLAFGQYVRTPWFAPSFLEDPPPLAQALIPSSAASRLYHSPLVTDDLSQQMLKRAEDYLFFKEALAPSYGMSFGLREVSSYQVLKLARAERFQSRLAIGGPSSPLLSWAGISTIITRKPSLGPWGPHNLQVISTKNYELPLFFEGHRVSEKVNSATYRAGSIEAQVESDRADGLVFSEVAYPGWRVFVDGDRKIPDIFKNTYLSVHVPSGKHSVKFQFISLSFWLGLGISAATGLGLLFYLLTGRT